MTADHHDDRQLDELLVHSYQSLREDPPGQREAVIHEFGKLGASGRTPRRASLPRAALLALAVCLLAAATVRLLMVASSPGVAYGLETVPQRLLDVQTIRLRGTRFVYDHHHPGAAPTKVPFEYLLRRPNKFRYTWTSSQQRKEGPVIEHGSRTCDGHSVLGRNDTKRQFSTGPVLSPLSVRVETEDFAQMFILTAMLGPPETSFHKVGQEKINGQWCELYEGQLKDDSGTTVERLWFDPTRGHPARIERGDLRDDGTIQPSEEIDEIAVNLPLGDELFDVKAPADYEPLPRVAETVDRQLALSPYPRSGGSAGGAKLETWYAWKISDRTALMVWRRSAPAPAVDGSLDWLSDIELKLEGPDARERAVRHAWVHQSGKPDEWNWSLVAITGGQPPRRVALELQVHNDRGVCSMGIQALLFPDNELEDILVESGRSTLPANMPTPSLAELRARAEVLVNFHRER